MNEPADKPLHDWVRQSLQTYRPPYEPENWQRMQRQLRRRRWWRMGLFGGLGLLLLGIGWYVKKPVVAPARPESVSRKASSALPSPERFDLAHKTPTRPARISKPVVNHINRSRGVVEKFVPALAISPVASLPLRPLETQINDLKNRPIATISPEEASIRQQLQTGRFGDDSTSYQVIERNIRRWPDAVVVCDLTTSMYPYSTQVFAWLRRHARNPAIKGFIFFTDCDSLGQPTRPDGPPGQFYVTRQRNGADVMPTMLQAARNTVRNDDDAENNVEALLFAQKTFPDAKHLILIADNISTVKDMHRLGGLTLPVHVILCGTTGSEVAIPFQAHYEAIARQTNGSLHTLEDDLDPNVLSPDAVVRVGPRYYRYQARKKRFKLTQFDHRPIRVLGLFWL